MAHAGHICSVCTHNQFADIQRALDSGARLAEVANQYGLTRSSLYRHIDGGHRRNGVESMADSENTQADMPPVDTELRDPTRVESFYGDSTDDLRAELDPLPGTLADSHRSDSEPSWLELGQAAEAEAVMLAEQQAAIIAEQAAALQVLQRELAAARTASVELVDTAEVSNNPALSVAPEKAEPVTPPAQAQMLPGLWLRRPDGAAVFVPEHIPMAIQRCRDEYGWTVIPDPRNNRA